MYTYIDTLPEELIQLVYKNIFKDSFNLIKSIYNISGKFAEIELDHPVLLDTNYIFSCDIKSPIRLNINIKIRDENGNDLIYNKTKENNYIWYNEASDTSNYQINIPEIILNCKPKLVICIEKSSIENITIKLFKIKNIILKNDNLAKFSI